MEGNFHSDIINFLVVMSAEIKTGNYADRRLWYSSQ